MRDNPHQKEDEMSKEVNTPEVSPNEDSGNAEADTSAEAPATEDRNTETGTDNAGEEKNAEENPKQESKAEETNYEKRYKDLQSKFTKTSQEAKELKQFKESLEGNKEFQSWVNEQRRARDQEKKPDLSNMTDEERFNYLVDERVDNIIGKRVQPFIDATANKQAAETLNSFFKENPEAKNKQNEIADVMEKYNMPINEAWKYLSADGASDKAKQELLQEAEKKKKANLEMPKSKPSSTQPKRGMSVNEAYEYAKKQLKK